MNFVPTAQRCSRPVLLLLLALAGVAGACQAKPAAPPVSADAWAVVNGREITREDVEKAYRRNLQGPPPASDEETATAKLEVLDQLIVQDLLLAKAREAKIEAAGHRARRRLRRGSQGHHRRGLRAGTGQAEPDRRRHARRAAPGHAGAEAARSARSRRRSSSPTRRSRRISRPIARSSTAPRTPTASRRSSSRPSATREPPTGPATMRPHPRRRRSRCGW